MKSDDNEELNLVESILKSVCVKLPTAREEKLEQLTNQFAAMMVELDAPSIVEDARLRAERRVRVFNERGGMLSAEDIHILRGSTSSNISSTASRLVREGKIFSVYTQGQHKYPAYQFDLDTGKPWPGLASVLSIIGKEMSDWELAVWFITPNGWLDDDEPIERIKKGAIDDVITAANDEVNPGIY